MRGWYNCYTCGSPSIQRRASYFGQIRTAALGFEEAPELFEREHITDRRSDDPEQFRAIGWVSGKLYSVIYEVRQDGEGEFYHLVTLWKSTKEERNAYAENIS